LEEGRRDYVITLLRYSSLVTTVLNAVLQYNGDLASMSTKLSSCGPTTFILLIS
jgi:hypothetical protein